MPARPRSLPHAPVLFTIALLAALCGTVLGIAAHGDNVLPGDIAVSQALQAALPAPLEPLAQAGHHLGSTLGGGLILLSAILMALALRAIPEAFFLMFASTLRLLSGLLKPLFDSPRPPANLVQVIGSYDGTGYPSGHAQTGALIGLAFAVIAWRRMPDRRHAMSTAVALMAFGGMIGWSRIALGAHWPSDVLGGVLFGTAIVAIAATTLPMLDARQSRST